MIEEIVCLFENPLLSVSNYPERAKTLLHELLDHNPIESLEAFEDQLFDFLINSGTTLRSILISLKMRRRLSLNHKRKPSALLPYQG